MAYGAAIACSSETTVSPRSGCTRSSFVRRYRRHMSADGPVWERWCSAPTRNGATAVTLQPASSLAHALDGWAPGPCTARAGSTPGPRPRSPPFSTPLRRRWGRATRCLRCGTGSPCSTTPRRPNSGRTAIPRTGTSCRRSRTGAGCSQAAATAGTRPIPIGAELACRSEPGRRLGEARAQRGAGLRHRPPRAERGRGRGRRRGAGHRLPLPARRRRAHPAAHRRLRPTRVGATPTGGSRCRPTRCACSGSAP